MLSSVLTRSLKARFIRCGTSVVQRAGIRGQADTIADTTEKGPVEFTNSRVLPDYKTGGDKNLPKAPNAVFEDSNILEFYSTPKRKSFKENLVPDDWMPLIERYPEFLPDPLRNNRLLVMQAIDDMLKRRTVIEIPEFYVGSILAVTTSDQYSETKRTRFVGICIHRTGRLTRANFTLRNIIDGMGCEIRYDLYNPLILSIEVLKLEKRIDESIIYLRDALPEYSTVPENMKPVTLEEGAPVPVNKTLVKMRPRPWSRKWERHHFRGIEKIEDVPEYFANREKLIDTDPAYDYDTMLEYRRHCTEELMYNICKRLADHEKAVVVPRKEATARKYLRVTKTPIEQTIPANQEN